MARSGVTKGKLNKIEGVPEVLAAISATIDRVSAEKAKAVFMTAAMPFRNLVEQNAPRDSGLLASAVFVTYGDKTKPNVIVSVNRKKTGPPRAPHAWWLEFGNSRINAQPYVRPALSATRNIMATTIADGLKALIEGKNVH